METLVEEWKAVSVTPYNTIYEVSNLGNVRNVKGNTLTPHVRNNYGHLCIDFWKDNKRKTFYIHRLVALSFISEPPTEKHEVRHLDGNTANNNVNNLQWGTSAENTADCRRHGTMPLGDGHKNTKIADADLPRIFEMRKRGMTQLQIAEYFNVHRVHIGDILNGSKRTYAQKFIGDSHG